MTEIKVVDSTLRDGHQSLWACRMAAGAMLSIAPTMAEAGFKRMQIGASGNHFVVYMRYLRENPLERLRLISKAMPNVMLSGGIRSRGAWGFDSQSDAIVGLFIKQIAACGVKHLMIFDALHTFSKTNEIRRIARAEGMQVEVPLVFSISPVHTDEYYAQKAAEVAKLDNVDSVLIKDSIGLLTPERTKTLVPAILKNVGKLPVEIHAHCTTGLAPLCYLEAVKLGVKTVHTCSSPLANSNSLPSTEYAVKNLRQLGYTVNLDDQMIQKMAEHFRYVGKREGKPIGAPVEYDLFLYEHQIPGGMRSNLESQLAMRGETGRLQEVLDETVRVRKEMGYAVMITPLSQIMGTQAVLNVVTGERYKIVTDELYKYALGYYGDTPAPIDSNVKDKIFSTPKGKEYLNYKLYEPSIEEIRKEVGGNLSDEELLLQLVLPEENIKNLLSSGPMKTDYPSPALEKPAMVLIRELAQRSNLAYMQMQREDFSLTLRKSG
ncbi:hypothetical protein ACFLV0_03685 [Chloroflexota bacterium]